MRLAEKTALVTGGSRGIGRAVALRLAQEGARVAITFNRGAEAAEAVLSDIRSAGGTALAIQHDAGEFAKASDVVERVVGEWGKLDVLVNNAGIIRDGLVIQMSDEDWAQVVQTNLSGTFAYCRAASLAMMKKRTGSIISMSSVAAQHSNKGQANYAAAKAGVEALTRTLAAEMAGRKIRVNAIAPGFIETDMTTAVRNAAGDKILAAIPLKRYGAATDIAAAAAFLASDDSAYVTGQVLTVDGGLSLGGQA
jgi:Dehydrogenases with different specificities (related to short-chain alcohol dehydrogenases)